MKQKIFAFILIVLSAFVCAQLEVTVINVGQGDSIFIKAPNNVKILLDAGSARDAEVIDRSNALNNIVQVLTENGISTSNPLDYIIVSHFHSDHYSYVDNIIQQFGMPKNGIIDRGGSRKWSGSSLAEISADYLAAVGNSRNLNGVMQPGQEINLGSGAKLVLLAIGAADEPGVPARKVRVWGQPDAVLNEEYENAKSLVFALRWNGFDMLLGGDSNEEVEPSLIQVFQSKNIHIDMYKVHHHGSSTSSSSSFLAAMMPETAICSVGNSAIYQHPRREVFDNIYQYCRAFIFQTSPGYNGVLSYVEPPAGYGILVRGSIKLTYNGGQNYNIDTASQQYTFAKDE